MEKGFRVSGFQGFRVSEFDFVELGCATIQGLSLKRAKHMKH